MTENIIEIKNVTIKYGKEEIIKDACVNIKKGEYVSIIGPNGAGKSTIIKAITKSVGLSNGDILIKGKNIKKITYKEKAKIIGLVPQEFSISFDFTVFDIVSMGRNPYVKKFSKSNMNDKEIIEDVLKKTNTFQFKDKLFNNLSGGEKQRVITARALAQQPEILILDEATSNLDAHHQLDILELIHWLNRSEGLTVLSVMHDLNLAARFSDKLILMNKGKIIKEAAPDEVLNENVLREIYDMEMVVRQNKLLSCKEVIPLRVRKAKTDKNIKIHIICGGGTGQYIIQRLYSKRYKISCGILNDGDSDLDLCKSMGIDYVSEDPFTTFSEGSLDKNIRYINEADIIVITDVAVGTGNFKNIKMVENIVDKKIIILHSTNRDFVDGRYEEIINKMKKQKNIYYAMNLKNLFDEIEKLS